MSDRDGADEIVVQIRALPNGEGMPLPSYMTAGAAGCDLFAAIARDITLEPGARALVPTGISIALPHGYEAQVRPRSGLAVRHGVTCLNAPGTIDSDYRGEVGIVLINHGSERFVVHRGERVAQLIIAPVTRARFEPVGELPPSERDAGGFGSTGTHGAR